MISRYGNRFNVFFLLLIVCIFVGEKLVLLKSRLQQAMAIRRKEERERRAALHRLDNEDCEEEEEAEMTESEDEEVLKIGITFGLVNIKKKLKKIQIYYSLT